eukprot:1733137-Pyramimonas_sp.AAC.1
MASGCVGVAHFLQHGDQLLQVGRGCGRTLGHAFSWLSLQRPRHGPKRELRSRPKRKPWRRASLPLSLRSWGLGGLDFAAARLAMLAEPPGRAILAAAAGDTGPAAVGAPGAASDCT